MSGHNRGAADRLLMVEHDAVRGMHAIGFAIVDDDPVGIEYRRGIGRARVERRRLALRHFLNQTIEFGSRSLVETAALLNAEDTDRLEQPERAYAVGICRIFGRFEAHLAMTLRGKVIDLVGLGFLIDPAQIGRAWGRERGWT